MLYKNHGFDTTLFFFISMKAISILRLKIVLKITIFQTCVKAEKTP